MSKGGYLRSDSLLTSLFSSDLPAPEDTDAIRKHCQLSCVYVPQCAGNT